MTGTPLGHYEINELLGWDGRGEVYFAKFRVSGEKVTKRIVIINYYMHGHPCSFQLKVCLHNALLIDYAPWGAM